MRALVTAAVLAGLFGLLIGSFLNVVIARVPAGESVVRPGSRCPRCGVDISARDNIPVLGWLLLRGRARCCGAPISRRYPIVEAATGAAFVAVVLWLGMSWALPAWLYLVSVSIALTLIDLDHKRLPDVLTLPSYPIGLGLLVLASLAGNATHPWSDPRRAVIGGAALWAFYALVYVVARLIYGKPAFGRGDVKLSGVLGMYLAWLGWGPLIVGAFGAFLLGGLGGVVLILCGRASLATRVPFGPYMIIGAWLAALWGQDVARWYLDLTGL